MSKFLRQDKNYNLTSVLTLSEEQVEGVEFLLTKYNAIVGFQTGLGKTLTVLTAAQHVLNGTSDTICFILCPKTANTAFIKTLDNILKVKYSIYTTDIKNIVNGSRFFIFNYSYLNDMVKYLYALKGKGYKIFAIADEIHLMQSESSNQSELLRKIRNEFACVFGCTATPLLNELEGCFRVVDFVNPGYLGTYFDFVARYIIYRKRTIRVKGKTRQIQEVAGYKNLEELSKRLEGVVIVRRLLYNLDFIYKQCSLTAYEEEQYEIAASGLLVDTENEKAIAARLHDLQRVVDGSHQQMDEGTLYSKHKLLISTLYECLSRGEGVIVYTEYEDTYKTIGAVIEKYKGYLNYNDLYYITGKVPYKTRVTVEQDLKAKDIVVITRAGCQSINLQAVNNVIFYNTPFAVGWFIQAVGRVTRMDTKYTSQNIYVLEVKDTIDTYKRLLIQDHSELIRIIFGKEGNLPDIDKLDKDVMKKYRSYFKRKLLWKK